MTKSARSLEQRLCDVEDRLEIYDLIASHPPSADTGADYYTKLVYTEDGELDLGRGTPVTGNETIAAITKTTGHQAAIAGGLAHFAGLPKIVIDGDKATVTSYLQILTPHPTDPPHEVPNHGVSNGFRIHRVAANRWDLQRTSDGWKIRRRTVRTIDGSDPPREILRGALKAYQSTNTN
jgi:SnoaL-like domain